MKKIVVMSIVIVCLFVLSSTTVFAQETTPAEVEQSVTVTPTCIPPNEEEAQTSPNPCVQVDTEKLGFQIPSLSDILTFAIRAVFVIGGLLALVMLLLGAISWITSGGEKENVTKSQKKIQAAIIGVILIAVVLAIIATLEQVIFRGTVCLGLTCPITIPSLLEKTGGNEEAVEISPADGSNQEANGSAETELTTELTVTPAPSDLENANNGESKDGEQQTATPVQPTPTLFILPDTGGRPR